MVTQGVSVQPASDQPPKCGPPKRVLDGSVPITHGTAPTQSGRDGARRDRATRDAGTIPPRNEQCHEKPAIGVRDER